MATYAFTDSEIVPGGATQGAIAGTKLDAGDFVYLDPADGKARMAQADSAVEMAKVAGIAVNSAFAGQPVAYAASGEVTVDAATFGGEGSLIVLSPTPGRCMDAADAATAEYLTVIGWSTATNRLKLNLAISGVQKA